MGRFYFDLRLSGWEYSRLEYSQPASALRVCIDFTFIDFTFQNLLKVNSMKTKTGLNTENHEFDVCVIGGGMAGLCAAIASARGGAKTALIHDRSVLGGNASSEVRMWICGARGKHDKETGLLEEIQLEHQYRNPSLNYSVWDSVLWGKAAFQPNLSLFLNAAVADAQCDKNAIIAVRAYQSTSQTWHTVHAKYFVDCSGDSILAALTPAAFRQGREAREEFDEDIQPQNADAKTMGNSLLIQLRKTDDAQHFTPPHWAYKFSSPEDLPHRMHGVNGTNFWWIEIGGLQDTIKDAENINAELHKITYGVWDYIKNHAPEKEAAKNWAIEWIGSLPGKRESRRYEGAHILTQNDIRDGGKFDDIVAYGGWSMDDHHPAGIYYPGHPTIFHPAPSPYGIPYRSLYSRNMENLFFAGRNISVTHAALSSTRVMGTCAILGQAAGTAAALCARHSCAPRELSSGARLHELQKTLMDDDCWLPGVLPKPNELTKIAQLCGNGEVELLRDGMERDRENQNHAWKGKIGDAIEYRWKEPVNLQGARLVFDSNLANEKRMPCSYPQNGGAHRVPKSLVKRFRLETCDSNGVWRVSHRAENNIQRLAIVGLSTPSTGLRLVPEETWGDADVRIFAFEPLQNFAQKIPVVPNGAHFRDVVSRLKPEDLAPPENSQEGDRDPAHAA